jgi:uncharacterized protein YbaR (Trm112 family)
MISITAQERHQLRENLVCPSCRGELEDVERDASSFLGCIAEELLFPVVAGVPWLVRERARRWRRSERP